MDYKDVFPSEEMETAVEVDDEGEERDIEASPKQSGKKWTDEEILLLIRTMESNYEQFNTKLKKTVFDDIAKQMNKVLNQSLTGQQIDTKWKGLKLMYKKVKAHNDTSGNAPKQWKFYNAIDMFLAKKPEINPVAVASSSGEDVEQNSKEKPKKKKDEVERRHQERLQRQDRFLDLFQQFLEKKD
ncbi:hypothetical protein MTP99_015922 [Tenebrio molitor]|jgi:hypothetical protein|nr:hypothetical protein MTP99_015922 [Tenebrio molitor]CAH1374606.1 unnamed protein product [Tenebrio molitor]